MTYREKYRRKCMDDGICFAIPAEEIHYHCCPNHVFPDVSYEMKNQLCRAVKCDCADCWDMEVPENADHH